MGWTPCFVASWFNEVDMLKLLISKGADLNALDPTGKTSLVIAVLKNNEQIVSVLLKNRADINDIFEIECINFKKDNPHGFNFALGIAIANNNHKIVELLTDFMKSRNEIEVAFPSQVKYKYINNIPEMLDLFLNEIKCQE